MVTLSPPSVPRLVIAAPASGSGKTTVATGLMAAYTERGLAVSPHKVGPDYIDPGYHALATGRPGRNLDPYLCGAERMAPLFLHGASGCGLALVEGVMGLYDGASGLGELASTAQVAKLLRAPVVLVVDASSQARSVAALVHGFASFDPGVRIGGVVLNKVGSQRHEAVLRAALEEEAGVPVLGVLPRGEELRVPGRHLGLVPAAERRAEAVRWVRALAARVRQGCDLEAILALARTAPGLPDTPWDAEAEISCPGPAPSRNQRAVRSEPATAPRANVPHGAKPPTAARANVRRDELTWAAGTRPAAAPAGARGAAPVPGRAPAREKARRGRPVVAVAGGAAFTFAYAEQAELLTAAGADVVPFDPLRAETLPDGTAGIILGGGFPEIYAADLSANDRLRKEVAAFPGPIAAECAGLLYLTRTLDAAPMCGVLDATARMTGSLALGYREAVALSDNALAPAGTRLRGHEFHRTRVTPGAGAAPAWGFTYPERRTEGFVERDVHASYLHVHWAAEPSLARRFVERCAAA